MKGNSECCDAVLLGSLCSDCKEYSGPIPYDCSICEDTGEVSCDERDSDGNWQRGVGTQKCECQVVEPDHDNQDEI